MSEGTDPRGMDLSEKQLVQLANLARRAHDGSVQIREVEIGGLPYAEVAVLLTDMGDVPPLHVFLLDPRGVIRPGDVAREALAPDPPQANGECPEHKWMGRVAGSPGPCPQCCSPRDTELKGGGR